MIIFFLIVSFIASAIGAICGIGGGVITIPVLNFFDVLKVNEISFLSSCAVLSMSLYIFVISKIKQDSLINSKVATPLALGSIIGSILGKMLFSYVMNFFNSENAARAFQSITLIILTFIILIFALKNIGHNKIKSMHIQNIFLCVVIGLFLGFLSSFLGIDSGIFNIVFLYLFFGMDLKVAAQNSLYIILFLHIANVFISFSNGEASEINLYFLVVMIIGAISGAILGRFINKKIDVNIVNRLFIILLLIIILITSYNFYNFSFNM